MAIEPGRQFLYHGTVHPFEEGDTVLPRATTGQSTIYKTEAEHEAEGRYSMQGVNDENYAFATDSASLAKDYAARRATEIGGNPLVYQVSPVDPEDVGGDEYGEWGGGRAVKSQKGFKVVKRLNHDN